MSTSKPNNPAVNKCSFDALIPGDRDVQWPYGEFIPNPAKRIIFRRDGRIECWTIVTQLPKEGSRSFDGGCYVFSSVFNGETRMVFINQALIQDSVNDKEKKEFEEQEKIGSKDLFTFVARLDVKPAQLDRWLQLHKVNQYLYLLPYSQSPMTQAQVKEFIQRRIAAKQQFIERTQRWNPSECSSNVNKLRCKHNRDTDPNGIYCNCGFAAVATKVKKQTSLNEGQWFWTCIIPYGTEGRCDYFQWVDEKAVKKNEKIAKKAVAKALGRQSAFGRGGQYRYNNEWF